MENQRSGLIKQVLLLLFLIALIGGSVFWIVRSFLSDADVEKKPVIHLYCTECHTVYPPKERLGGEHPRICDKCGKRTAWFAMKCNNCGTIFPQAPSDHSVRGGPYAVICPNCNSADSSMFKGQSN